MLQCEGYFSYLRRDIKIPNGDNAHKWVVNMLFKFHDDPTVNDSEIVIFLRQVWWSTGKDRVLREREEKTKLRERGG